MKYVLDQNKARKPELDKFLKSGNEIIITDDFILEPFKSSNFGYTIDLNLKILRKYPNQILVAFDRGELINKELKQGSPLTSSQLISTERTEIIKDLLNLNEADLGCKLEEMNREAKKRIASHDDFTEEHIRNISKKAFVLIKKGNQAKEYRTNKLKKLNDIKEIAFKVLEMQLKNKLSKEHDLNSFIGVNSVNFAYLFTHLWRVVDWAIKGGVEHAKTSIKGDTFDIKYILISCFFDGVLTDEKWLSECRSDTLSII